jgi:putative PIN family toxin of toxin-antitoxin system
VKPVVVFDTNVLFSAIGWRGNPARCLQLARDGHVDGVTCTEILNELAEKLTLKLGFTTEQVISILGSLMTFLRPVTITGQAKGLCADPKDDMVLECALVARATHIVSGDKKHLLSMKQFRGIAIVAPVELLRAVTP